MLGEREFIFSWDALSHGSLYVWDHRICLISNKVVNSVG